MGEAIETGRVAARSRVAAMAALALAGVGISLILLEGSWGWAVVRVLVAGAVVSRAMGALRGRSPGRAAAVAVALGTVTGCVGAAIAVPWWSANGIGVRSVGGALALGGGLVLVAAGLRLAWVACRGWRRAVVGIGLVVAAYPVCLPLVVAVSAVNVPRRDVRALAPGELGRPAREVSLRTADGVRLAGWYVASRNRAAVVVLHGASSNRAAVVPHAAVLARHGYGVLVLDARGTGRSGGRAMNLGWWGERDVAAAFAFLARQADVDPGRIGALGESMGGEEAIGALAAVPGLRAVVAEGATGRIAADHDWLSRRYGVRGLLQEGVDRLTYGLTDLLTDAPTPRPLRAAIASSPRRPVLLVVAGDVADERHAAEALRAASPATVEVWVVAGAGHTGGLATDPDGWARRVDAFFDHALLEGG